MDEGSTGRSIREWQAHVDTVLKDLALADAQRYNSVVFKNENWSAEK